MRIIVDGRSLLPIGPGLGPTGVGRWTRNVIRALGEAAPEWEIVLTVVTREEISLDVSGFTNNVRPRVVRLPERWFRRALVLGFAPRVDRFVGPADVMLGPGFITWPGRFASLPVIHDLAFLAHPTSVQRRNLAYLRLMVPRVVRRAARVITVSETVKDEIADRMDFPLDRISVVPNGVGTFEPGTAPSGFQPGYLLFVGTFEPRKNLASVLSAYSKLRSERQSVPELVVVGGPGWRGATELHQLAAATPGVRTVGYVDDERLATLYRDASMLVFPSLYEGFGLPVIEAMAAGVPVVTSDTGALSEVAGDAALLVNPSDDSEIVAAIGRLLDEPALRETLTGLGLKRASTYSWDRSGRELKRAIASLGSR